MQELFNTVAKHLLTQMAKATGYTDSSIYACAYRGVFGRKCAIGVLISDEEYKTELEGKSLVGGTGAPVLHAVERSIRRKLEGKELNLLSALQGVHDLYPVQEWKERLSRIADTFSLSKEAVN